jgi:hypothetical protein
MLVYQRGKGRVKVDYKFDEIYKFYQERWGEKALPRKTVMQIYKKLLPAIVKLIIFENLDFRMPGRLGYLRIKKKLKEVKLTKSGEVDARNLSIDWKKTKQYWETLYPGKTAQEIAEIKDKPLVREMNEDTNGYRMLWFWDKLTCNIRNQSAYYLDMSRDNDRILSRGIKFNNLNFYT